MQLPRYEDILDAQKRIGELVHRTPVLTSAYLNRLTQKKLFFKCENFQRGGAFKFRGASHALSHLDGESLQRGVATHSSGNHAGALALAAQMRGVKAHVVMPSNSVPIKRAAVLGYGAEVIDCEPNQQAREDTLTKVVAKTGATFIHPYDHVHVMSGQGTAALEFCDEVPGLDALVAPVGGGGLLSGTALVGAQEGVVVYGAEPAGADDAFRSLRDGQRYPSVEPQTICDGLRTSLGERAFAVLDRHLEEVLVVTDEESVAAMRLLWERMKIVVEPSAATVLAAVLKYPLPQKRIGMILSGGNVDLNNLPF